MPLTPQQHHHHHRRWAANLRAARLKLNLTQYEAGRRMNIDQQNISRWESGRSVPRDDMKFRLAAFYGVAVADLFPWDDPANGDEQVAS